MVKRYIHKICLFGLYFKSTGWSFTSFDVPGSASALQAWQVTRATADPCQKEVDLQCEEPLFSDGSSEPR
ncbi:unnamed protein product [Arctogadus glacialis]